MTQEEKDKLAKFCYDNMHTHTDWTGTRVETISEYESVFSFINQLIEHIES